MRMRIVALVCAALGIHFFAQPAAAIPNFQKAFLAEYIDANGDVGYVALVKETKCNVCHDANSKSKKDRNPYGEHLSELLDKKADKDDMEKITSALHKVGAIKSNPDDPASPTYEELIKSSKLPGGQ